MDKISIEEIAKLKEKAINERNNHRSVMNLIAKIGVSFKGFRNQSSGLPNRTDLNIVLRGNIKEIKALLEAYATIRTATDEDIEKNDARLDEEAQLFIYNSKDTMGELRRYMLLNISLHFSIEKLLIDDEGYDILKSRRISAKGEEYLVLKALKYYNEGKYELYYIVEDYIAKGMISEIAQISLMQYISKSDSPVLFNLVKFYIDRYKYLHPKAQEDLIRYGNHELIMLYIKTSNAGIQAEDALLERANREEVVAYFERYATM